jgi:glycerate-2-kinase
LKDTHPPLHPGGPHAEAAVEAFLAGLAAADPTVLVRNAVRQGHLDRWLFEGGRKREEPRLVHVLALGKAAPRMLWGLVEGGVPFDGLGVAPKGVAAPGVDTFRWLPGDHPVPADASLAAGKAVLEWADAVPEGEPVLVLLSGGASACAEVPEGILPAELCRRWEELLRSGEPIESMNRQRAAWSALKGGKDLQGRVLAASGHRPCHRAVGRRLRPRLHAGHRAPRPRLGAGNGRRRGAAPCEPGLRRLPPC